MPFILLQKKIYFPCFFFQMENPWNIQSIYEFQFFICPSCIFKNHSKQEFINHAYEYHPESIEYFKNINDESLNDIVFPSELDMNLIKTENYEVNNFNDEHDLSDVMSQNEGDPLNSIKVEKVETEHESQFENSETLVYEHFSQEASFDEDNINGELEEDEIFSNSELAINEIYSYSNTSWEKDEQNDEIEKMKKHKCEICKKAFITPSKLKRHSSTHKALKNNPKNKHKCEICERAFFSPSKLKRHSRIVHEGIKNYQCTYCVYASGTAQNLRTHINRYHEKY